MFRDQVCLSYEIPKWDGDLGRQSLYVPLVAGGRRSARSSCCTSASRRSGRDWWDDEVFLGLARLRGMECRARYAEAFGCAKLVIRPPRLSREAPPAEAVDPDTIADHDDAHPRLGTTDKPSAAAKAVSRCIKVSGRDSYISRVGSAARV